MDRIIDRQMYVCVCMCFMSRESLTMSQVGEGLVKDWNQAWWNSGFAFSDLFVALETVRLWSYNLRLQSGRHKGSCMTTLSEMLQVHFSGIVSVSSMCLWQFPVPAEPSRARSHEGGQARWYNRSPFVYEMSSTGIKRMNNDKWIYMNMKMINGHIMDIQWIFTLFTWFTRQNMLSFLQRRVRTPLRVWNTYSHL